MKARIQLFAVMLLTTGCSQACAGVDDFRVIGGSNVTYVIDKWVLPHIEYSAVCECRHWTTQCECADLAGRLAHLRLCRMRSGGLGTFDMARREIAR